MSKRRRSNPQEESVNENENSSSAEVQIADASADPASPPDAVTEIAVPAAADGKVTVSVISPFFCSSGRVPGTAERLKREVRPARRERARPPRTGFITTPADVIELDLNVESEREDYARWISNDWVVDTAVLTAAEAEIAAANGLSQGEPANA